MKFIETEKGVIYNWSHIVAIQFGVTDITFMFAGGKKYSLVDDWTKEQVSQAKKDFHDAINKNQVYFKLTKAGA